MANEVAEGECLAGLLVVGKLLYAKYHRVASHALVDGIYHLAQSVEFVALFGSQRVEEVLLYGRARRDTANDDASTLL